MGLLRWRGRLRGFFSSESDEVVFGLLLLGVFFSAAQAGGVFALCFDVLCFGFSFGLSLLSYRSISVAPVRGSTYFSLQRQRKVGKRKPLTPLTPV